MVALFAVDLTFLSGLVGRGKFKSSLYLTLFWTAVGVGFAGIVFWLLGTTSGVEYLTAYVAERALSIDNLFVFVVLFNFFNLPKEIEAYTLSLGILGALLARAVFIAVGVTLISVFSWILIPLGAILIYTAYKLWVQDDSESDPEKSLVVRAARKVIPVSGDYRGRKLFIRLNGKMAATPLLLVIVALVFADALFAIDSVPTVIGISKVPFVVWSSNAAALLGMRPLFFLLVDLVDRFRYLHYGLALVLGYIGLKLVFEEIWHLSTVSNCEKMYTPVSGEAMEETIKKCSEFQIIPDGGIWNTLLPLAIIILILGLSILLSVLKTRDSKPHTSD